MALMEYEFVRGHARRHADPATAHAAHERTAPHEIPEYVAARIAEERAHAVTRAVIELRHGRRGFAHFIMARSLLAQSQLAGIDHRIGDVSPRLVVVDPFLGSPTPADLQLAAAMGYGPADTGGAA